MIPALGGPWARSPAESLQLYLAVLFRWCERLGLGGGDRAAAPAWEVQGNLAHNLLFMDQAWEDWDSEKVLDIFHTTSLFKASPPFNCYKSCYNNWS